MKSVSEITDKMYGAEPKFQHENEISQIELIRALNWYNQNKDNKTSVKYSVDYFKKNKMLSPQIEKVLSDELVTFGYVCRIVANGGKLSEKDNKWFQSRIKTIKDKATRKVIVEVENKTEVKKVSIQERINEKAIACMGELEGAIDDYIISKYKKTPSVKAIMMDAEIKGVHANRIISVFKEKRDEFQNVIDSDDDQIVEGYSNFKKTDLKRLVTFCQDIVNTAQELVTQSVKTRKPRKVKAKTPQQLVSKIKYCIEDVNLKVKSVDPTQIIGAQQVWVFNTKYNKLGVYNADDSAGLSVKGSSILNYNEKSSVCKKVRKPEKTVPEVLKAGKVFLRNVIANIKAKEYTLNGRINSDTLILKIVK